MENWNPLSDSWSFQVDHPSLATFPPILDNQGQSFHQFNLDFPADTCQIEDNLKEPEIVQHRFASSDELTSMNDQSYTFPWKKTVDSYLIDPTRDGDIPSPDFCIENMEHLSQHPQEFSFNIDFDSFTQIENERDENDHNSSSESNELCNRKYWTEEKNRELIQMAQQMVEGKLCFTELGKRFSRQHPERTVQASNQYARKLAEQGLLNVPLSEQVKIQSLWTEEAKRDGILYTPDLIPSQPKYYWTAEETQELIQMAQKMVEKDEFSFPKLGTRFSTQYPERTSRAAADHARILYKQGLFNIPSESLNKSTCIHAPDLKLSKPKHLWTENEKQQLIQMAQQMVEEGNFGFTELARRFSKQHPERTLDAIRIYTRSLAEQGLINVPLSEKVKSHNLWKKKEKQQLIQFVEEMIEKGDFELGFTELARQFLKQNPGRTMRATGQYIQSLDKQNLFSISLSEQVQKIYWTENERQALIQLAEEMIRNGTFSKKALGEKYSELHPERSFISAYNCARKLIEDGILHVPDTKSENQWTEDEKQQLIQMAEAMIKNGTFSVEALCEKFLNENSSRTLDDVRLFVQNLVDGGIIIVPEQILQNINSSSKTKDAMKTKKRKETNESVQNPSKKPKRGSSGE